MKKRLLSLVLVLAMILPVSAASKASPYIGSDSGAAFAYTPMSKDEAKSFTKSADVIKITSNAHNYDFFEKTGYKITFEWVDGNGRLTAEPQVFTKISGFVFAVEITGEIQYVTVTAPGTYDVYGFITNGKQHKINAVYFGGLKDVPDTVFAYGNEFEIGTLTEFATGELNNLDYAYYVGDGALQLAEGATEGIYTSGIIDVPNFEYLVMSWNADTPAGTWVEVKARALVNHVVGSEWVQSWTPYLSWGKWSPFLVRRSISDNTNALARMNTDEFVIKGSSGETAEKIQLQVVLHSDVEGVTPVLRYLHGTLKNTLPGQTIEKDYRCDIDVTNLNKTIDVPQYSQMVRDPRNASSICSPTSVTMLMNGLDHDLNRIPEEVAQNQYDNAYGFGNWAFGMAAAGSYGFKAYVNYTDLEGVKKYIAQGYAVAASVSYSTVPGNAKYLEGAWGITPGHLVVIRGFKTVDGVDYVVCNDAYAADNVTVYREYKLDQFMKCWTNGVVYVVKEKEANAGTSPARRVEASLVEVTPGRFEVHADGFTNVVYNADGNVVYTTEPEVFQGADTTIYTPVLRATYVGTNTLPLPREDIDSPDFKLYVVTDVGYIFIVTYGNVTYLEP